MSSEPLPACFTGTLGDAVDAVVDADDDDAHVELSDSDDEDSGSSVFGLLARGDPDGALHFSTVCLGTTVFPCPLFFALNGAGAESRIKSTFLHTRRHHVLCFVHNIIVYD